MKRLWRLSRFVLIGLAVAALSAAVGSSRSAAAGEDQIVIAMPIPGPAPYFDGMFKRLNQLLAGNKNVKVVKTIGDWTPQKQAAQIDTLLAQKPDVVLYDPVDNKALFPSLVKLYKAGIPVVIYGATPDKAQVPYMKGYVGPNDVLQGQLAGKNLISALGGTSAKGDVAMIRGTPGFAASALRGDGFKQALKAAPGLKLVADQYSAWGDKKKTYDIATAMLKKNPKIVAIFSQDDTAGAGAAQAAKDLNLPVKVVGVGGSCAGFRLIKQGQIFGTTVQDPWDLMAKSFSAAVKVANGNKIPQFTYMQPPVVTKSNVQKFQCHW